MKVKTKFLNNTKDCEKLQLRDKEIATQKESMKEQLNYNEDEAIKLEDSIYFVK